MKINVYKENEETMNQRNCSIKYNQSCRCINCLLKEKLPKTASIEKQVQDTYCIKVADILKDIKNYFGDFEADEFWLTLLSLRTYFRDYYFELRGILNNEEYYRKKSMLSSSMLIDWDGSYIFKRIFIKYLKFRNLGSDHSKRSHTANY